MLDNIETIVKKQRDFFNTGATKDYSFRINALNRLQEAILYYQSDIEKALLSDLHKSAFEGYMTEIGLVLNEISFAKKHLKKWMKVKNVRTPLSQFFAKSLYVYEPYGVSLIMSPWNYPFMLCIEPLVGAIAAGNCCVIKPSAYSPAAMEIIAKIAEKAFKPEYITVVKGGRKENTILLEQRFDYIFFTGSISVGKLVMEKAAENLTPVTLELGGKSPCIVEKTADLKLSAKRIVFGKYLNCGQTCVAPDYLLIDKTIKDEFLAYVKEWISEFFGDNPISNSEYPKMINERHYLRVLNLIEGENIVTGGYGSKDSLQIAPTVLDNITLKSKIMQEEIFGPVLPVITYNDLSEAEDIIKSIEKPLALYLFTNNKEIEKRILKNLSYGGGCINDTVVHLATPYMGFGGVGYSGMGNYHGKLSFETFSHRKSILKRYNCIDFPIRYHPYTKTKEKLIKKLLK